MSAADVAQRLVELSPARRPLGVTKALVLIAALLWL